MSEELLTTVTNIVEWPVALAGTFKEQFLQMPKEILITTLETQQLCFPLADAGGTLLPRFIIIANLKSRAVEQVVAGYEKVVHARLTDAEYFYHKDLKGKLADNLNRLANVNVQEKLGTMFDKTQRLQTIGAYIGEKIGADIPDVKRAAMLAKCDLISGMVGEFPELQGVMGYYYAKGHEKHEVAYALQEQYLPRFANDQLPHTSIGVTLALADRVDNLVGFFGIEKGPTGDKDPFGLRRAALGLVRIILERELDLDLAMLIRHACNTYGNCFAKHEAVTTKVLDFVYERLRFLYSGQGKSNNVFNAVLSSAPTNLLDFTYRFIAVENFVCQSDIEDLLTVYKRVKNILGKSPYEELSLFEQGLATEKAEIDLAELVAQKTQDLIELQQARKYHELLQELTTFKKPLDNLFAKVMVMTDDVRVRRNRLALLQALYNLFLLIADLACLVSGGTAG